MRKVADRVANRVVEVKATARVVTVADATVAAVATVMKAMAVALVTQTAVERRLPAKSSWR